MDRIESPYIHWRELKVVDVEVTAGSCGAGVADAVGDEGWVVREGTVSDRDEGGNVNSGAERTRSEKKL
jgi:hypothetical protein